MANEVDELFAAIAPLLPLGWRASLQLEDPLTETLEEVAAVGDEACRTRLLAVGTLPEAFHELPNALFLARLEIAETRLVAVATDRPFGRLLLAGRAGARNLDSATLARIADRVRAAGRGLERVANRREEEKFSGRLRRIGERELAERVLESYLEALPRTLAAAVLVAEAHDLVVRMARRPGGPPLPEYVHRAIPFAGSHLAALSSDRGIPAVVARGRFDAYQEGRLFAPLTAEVRPERIETLPLEVKGRTVGSLLLFAGPGEESADDRRVVANLADELARAFDRLRPERRQAATLLYMQSLLRAPGRSLAAVLETVTDEMVRYLGADAGVLVLLDTDTGHLLLSQARGYEGVVLPESIPLADSDGPSSITATVFRSGEAYLAADTASSPIYLPLDPTIRSEIGVPLRLRGETFGVAIASSKTSRFFAVEDVGRFQLLADQVALAVGEARLLEALRAREGQAVARRQRLEFGFDPSVHADDIEYHFGNLVGDPKGPMGAVYEAIERVAAREDDIVLVTGETGTGKEMISQAIHHASPRRARPMVTTNFASLGGDPNLIQSELFGHERGSFTGAAARRRGCFERAHRSTLLIDEVGDIVPSVQVKLLRVLGRAAKREFQRLGGEEAIETDVRLLAATNKDLLGEIAAGRFRDDLYYRLSALVIRIPPLRERPNDLPLLTRHVLMRLAKDRDVRLGRGAVEVLGGYAWPGNVRQLESVLLRGLVLFGSPDRLTADDLRAALEAEAGFEPRDSIGAAIECPDPVPDGWFWDQVWKPWKERRLPPAALEALIRRLLAETGGYYSRVADRLGVKKADYQRFIDFLTHAEVKLDHRPFRSGR